MPLTSSNKNAFNRLTIINQFDEVVRAYKTLVEGSCEKEMLQLAKHFEICRKKWNLTECKCIDLQAILTKCEAEKNALMIKLKHARRQIEVELQGRHQAEQERDEFSQQLALVRELLLSDTMPSPNLTEEQQKKLNFLNSSRFKSPRGRARTIRPLHAIDETESMLSDYSDISFDVTEDDLDRSQLRNGKCWKRSRITARKVFDDDEVLPKKVRADIGINESLRCTVDGPATMHIEKLEKSFSKPNPHGGRRRPSREHMRKSITSESESQSEVEGFWPTVPAPSVRTKPSTFKHKVQMKPCVITKETCKPCGKRIQFGKKALKCADCRLVSHPECEKNIKTFPCELSSTFNSPASTDNNTLEDYLISDESPQIPPIIYHTVQEIERRGLNEVGLYRVPGMVRVVKALREKFKGKSVPKLKEVTDVHALCSLVKDFLRVTLNEPIITFKLRPKFIKASQEDDDSGLYEVLNELSPPNRDTLMFLILHFQRVINSPKTRMSIEGMSKAVGPSIIGYKSAEPTMQDIQISAKYQEMIVTRLLQLPADFYSTALTSVLTHAVTTQASSVRPGTPDSHKQFGSMLGPIGSPSKKTTSTTSLAERAKKYLGGSTSKRGKRRDASYFASPSLN